MPSSFTTAPALSGASSDYWDAVYTTQFAPNPVVSNVLKKYGLVKKMPPEIDVTKCIKDVLPVSSRTLSKEDSVVGIEIENEFKNPEVVFPRSGGWRREADNSLRYNGFEYVMEPTPYRDVSTRVERLCTALEKTGEIPTNSIRTSVHVHFDVTQLTFVEVVTFACVYWVLEEYLSSFAGETRKGNLFCLRMKDASIIENYLKDSLEEGSFVRCSLLSNEYRYASVNFAVLKKFGTLEFRLMRGTLCASEILDWVDALERIRKYSLKFKDPAHLYEHFIKNVPAEDFPKEVLGGMTVIYNAFNTEPSGMLVRKGFDSVEGILLATEDFTYSKQVKEREEALAALKKEQEERKKLIGSFNSTLIPKSGVSEEYEIAVYDSPLGRNYNLEEDL